MSLSGSPDSDRSTNSTLRVAEQHVRARLDLHRLDGVAKPALVDLFRRPAELDRDRAQRFGRRLIADKGDERFAVRGARGIERRVHLVSPDFTSVPPLPLGFELKSGDTK